MYFHGSYGFSLEIFGQKAYIPIVFDEERGEFRVIETSVFVNGYITGANSPPLSAFEVLVRCICQPVTTGFNLAATSVLITEAGKGGDV